MANVHVADLTVDELKTLIREVVVQTMRELAPEIAPVGEQKGGGVKKRPSPAPDTKPFPVAEIAQQVMRSMEPRTMSHEQVMAAKKHWQKPALSLPIPEAELSSIILEERERENFF
jgi:hypothetical protein